MRAIAIDFGGSHFTCALVEDDRVLASEGVDTEPNPRLEPLLPGIEAIARRLTEKAGVALGDCEGLAMGFPHIVDATHGKILASFGKYDDAVTLDVHAWSRERLGLRVALENDARLALLGEWQAGAARGCDDFVMLTLGTGIGQAAMIGGRLLRGAHALAANLGGHFPIRRDGAACICGGIGCVEAEGSTWALPRIVREIGGAEGVALFGDTPPGFRALFTLAAEGNAAALRIRDYCIGSWAAGVVANVHAYDPELVVIGGGVMASADAILPAIRDHVARHSFHPWGTVRIAAAELGNEAALLGAVPLLRDVTA